MIKRKKVVAVIPSRSQGDYINNLNFLYIGEKMVLEFTIISAIKSKIFDKIFVIFDNKKHKDYFERKYNVVGIVVSRKKSDFIHLVEKYKKTYFNPYSYISVLLPNSPFKNHVTIRKIYSKVIKENLNFIVTGSEERKRFYYIGQSKYKIIKRPMKNDGNVEPLHFISGGIIFFKKDFKNFKNYTNEIRLKNFYTINSHEGFSIITLYDLILASTINDIDASIFKNLLKKN